MSLRHAPAGYPLPEDLIREIEPWQIVEFAKHHGWHERPLQHQEIYLLGRQDDDIAQVLVPRNKNHRDYVQLTQNAVRELAEHAQCSASELLHLLLSYRADTFRCRVDSRDVVHGGSIPFVLGLDMMEGIKRAFMSAACSVVNPVKKHSRLYRREASQLLGNCMLDQSERGSFTLVVSCPLDDENTLANMDDEVPFARKTTRYLMQSVHRLASAIERETLDTVFDDDNEQPVISANLCEALLRMQPGDEDASLSLHVTWAPELPEFEVPSLIELRQHHFEKIGEIYEILWTRHKPRPGRYEASVEELKGDIDANNRRCGEVTLQLMYGEESLTVRANLDPDRYEVATRAHVENRMIAVKGVLFFRRRIHSLREIAELNIIDTEVDV